MRKISGICLLLVGLFIIFSFSVREISALKCYSCTSSMGHNLQCENITSHLSEISHHECFYHDAVCATYVIEYGNTRMIHRNCQQNGVCTQLAEKYDSPYNRLIECHTCHHKDLCNSSGKNYELSFIQILGPLLAALILRNSL